ncbi:hypothetical protein A3B05_00385 [Candidatus Giovannonibacteria bacterium RIFCSPLOWO2_01_FULL_43_160]|uniref:Uncharacterized protein n=2 Tax=Candidatus Giovannoniibacteriota TaxID=1752738 RepID=A0A0G1ISE7_9BACT|nr:MAG: hypothetical protein UV72_C0014G0011 [Candidatus Giovannonibacteria bacterium GW2011_GWB1_43_13]KKS99119.1 MAG: hypothetical protein UV75_C0009G0003 [Candidatus Giovannonibacteria bacterium GW2011_GWA1_43_15]KKT20463.1 MAG: hypothetical protein UW05_C0036G0015 [Candidatus Giovannonibacteria bacterium GW2011_GWC2_43_8]KKT62060.1 MAG: hypothetical protein UW55_C0018G0027 [Candidatus Giovannonibacteria bacterium GW2011_GWA2_44_26]OGF58334.1 MAG: hypothetical protein A2652_01350 [Candidatus
MIFYSIFLLLSVGGILAIIRRNRDEFVAFNFAEFMEGLQGDVVSLWHSHIKDQSLLFMEKRLRGTRIWALKTEHALFKAAKKLRGIQEKNGNGNNGSSQNDTDQNSPA